MHGPRYCGQQNVLMGYGRNEPWTSTRWAHLKDAIRAHRATCITCRRP